MAKGVAITYGDVAPEAKENFQPTSSECKYDTLAKLQRYNMQLYNYANPCELYQTLLDGAAIALPDDPTSANIGLWSEQLSNDDGTFTEPITLTLESEGQYSSQGFTFTFDKFNNIYPTKLTIQWLRVTSEGAEDLSDGAVEFNPTSGFFFCPKQVENFNKVIVTFYSLNMPKNRLKVETVDYGYGTVFYGGELRSVKLAQYLDPISSEMKISTCDFTLDSKSDTEYSFQKKQALSVSFNDKLLATVFVKTSRRKARFLWDINAEDYIGIMDSVPFVGGMYKEVAAGIILSDIFAAAKIPYTILSDEISGKLLSGYIPYTTCREALMQVCFACLAVVNTSNSEVVEIKKLDNTVKQSIPLRRVRQGQNFEIGDTVTGVKLTAHTYKPITDTLEVYHAEESGTGNNILVKFSEPLHDLEIMRGSFEVDESGNEKIHVNYAYINAEEGCIVRGQKYEHTQQEKEQLNSAVLASDTENIVPITAATLVSPAIVAEVLDNAYAWLSKNQTINLKIDEAKDILRSTHTVKWGEKKWGQFRWGENVVTEVITEQQAVNLGDLLDVEMEYLGTATKQRLIQQAFNLNGNIIVKEAVLK